MYKKYVEAVSAGKIFLKVILQKRAQDLQNKRTYYNFLEMEIKCLTVPLVYTSHCNLL